MKKTSVAVTAFIAGLSLAFVVPTSYAESKPAAKTSCQSDKPCSCAKKCPYNHKNHKCNATSKAKAQPDIKK
jgi:hypothetical protein|tara:strand:- start:3946 stop:4161 length:216 start_codon:yes stop_codon:yes gene_type:complete